jgi:poly-D-alanine transfer protein DltD
MGLESTTGLIAAISRELLGKGYETDKAFGRKVLEIVTNMKAHTNKIKNKDMVFLHGQQEMCIKGSFEKMLEMVMGKCTGMMEATTKESGKMESSMEKVKFMCLTRVGRKVYLKTMFSLS